MASLSLNLPLCTHRYFLMVSYIGTKYKGSQRLVNRNSTGTEDTIQEALEASIEGVFPRSKCRLTAGSRTDKGVHALMNCYTMPLMDFKVPTDRFKRLVNNSLLKRHHEIIVNEVLLVPAVCHPRRTAVGREYIYRIGVPRWGQQATRPVELFHAFPASELFRILPVPRLDMDKFEEAANLLRGVHDFKAFSFQPRETDDTLRNMEINVIPANETSFAQERSNPIDIYHVHFKSRAFLHNQVRRIIGAILSYASIGSINLGDIQSLLDNPDTKAWHPNMMIAEPWGLYLSRVYYDKSYFGGTIRTYEEGKVVEEVDLDSIPSFIDKPQTVQDEPRGNAVRQYIGDMHAIES